MTDSQTLTIFENERRLLTGALPDILTFLKGYDPTDVSSLLIFDDQSGRQRDFDLSGTLEEVLAREIPAPKSAPGRPKLGVTAREVTLLPRHWDWLEQQRGGASATLRRLIDEERKRDPEAEAVASAQAAADRFLGATCGNQPGYEEATRALYARDKATFVKLSAAWPTDLRAHALHLAAPAFAHAP